MIPTGSTKFSLVVRPSGAHRRRYVNLSSAIVRPSLTREIWSGKTICLPGLSCGGSTLALAHLQLLRARLKHRLARSSGRKYGRPPTGRRSRLPAEYRRARAFLRSKWILGADGKLSVSQLHRLNAHLVNMLVN